MQVSELWWMLNALMGPYPWRLHAVLLLFPVCMMVGCACRILLVVVLLGAQFLMMLQSVGMRIRAPMHPG